MRLRVWLGLALVLALCGGVDAATRYVSKTGNNGNACSTTDSAGTNKLTIAAGIGCMSVGDTLFIHAGTYAETLNSGSITFPVGTSFANAPLISAFAGETVIVMPNAGQGEVLNLASSSLHYIIFQNIIWDGTGGAAGGNVISLNGVDHIRFTGGEIRNAVRQGLLTSSSVGPEPDFNEILNMKIHHNGQTSNLDHGIYYTGSDALIKGNEIYNNCAYGIQVYDGDNFTAHRNVLDGNYIHDNNTCGSGRGGIVTGSGNGNVVKNNIIVSNSEGIAVGYNCPCTGTMVYNNTIYNNSSFAIDLVSSGATGTLVRNNIIYGTGGIQASGSPSGTVYSNNLCQSAGTGCTIAPSNPLFVNPAAPPSGFQLSSTSSPAYNAGFTIPTTPSQGAVLFDFTGTVSRPQAGSYDIGAYEFAAGGDTTPPTVSLTAPSNGANVSGNVTVSANAADDVGVVGVQFILDGANLGAEDTVAPYSITWNSATATNGTHTLRAQARDTVNTTLSSTISVTVSGGISPLVAKYDFEAGTGPPGDTSGNGLNATTFPGTTYITPGKHGTTALHCNGTTGLVTVADAPLLDLTTAFSLMAWIRPTVNMAIPANTYRTVLAKDPAEIYYLYASHGDASNFPAGGYYDGATYFEMAPPGPILPINVWTHYAITWDGANLRNYRGGTLEGSPFPATGLVQVTAGNLTFCGRLGTVQLFEGDIDDVRIYSNAQSPAELAVIIAEAAGDTMPPAAPANLRVVP